MKPSRYIRPKRPRAGLCLQPRDRAILEAVAKHRFIQSDHVHRLLFAGTSLHRAQSRLRLLWEHELVDRVFFLQVVTGMRPINSTPAYTLTQRGANILAAVPELAPTITPLSLTRLEHQLVVTDFLVALEVASRGRDDIRVVEAEGEGALWRHLSLSRKKRTGNLVPDAFFTLGCPGGRPSTFYLEVVRADVKGGNDRLRSKLARYVELNREGWFKTTYGHEHVRAVIIATTSEERAEHFQKLAKTLPHGRRLFWFGSFRTATPEGRATAAFTPKTVLDHQWTTTEGEVVSLGGLAQPTALVAALVSNQPPHDLRSTTT